MYRSLRAPVGRVSVLTFLLICPAWFSPQLLGQSEADGQQAIESTTGEAELIAILASPSAEPADKAMACKRLAVYGSQAASEELGKLLADPQLASWARIALEAIPGEQPSTVLRQALGQVNGLLQIGIINSLAARRDDQATPQLAGLMRDGDPEVAGAAAFALGKIGTSQASKELLSFLSEAPPFLKAAVAEGAIYSADQLRKSGESVAALEIYDSVRSSELPIQRVIEATRGAILVQADQGIPLLVELLRSDDRRMLALGLQTARELVSDNVGAALMAEIGKATADRAALLVETLGDLPGQADLNSLQSLASQGSQEVRMAAISVLGRVGDASILPGMLQIARESNDLQTAVRAALVDVPDDNIDQEILGRLSGAAEDKRILLELVGLRQLEATDQLVQALESPDAAVRGAAIDALGQTVPQSRLQVLVDLVVSPKNPEDMSTAVRALRIAAVRMPDREACAQLLGTALQTAPASAKSHLLETIAAVGGTESLRIVGEYGFSSDESLRDLSTRLLGEWMTIDVAPVLLDLATRGPADRFQVRALRGYIRVARQFIMPDDQRMEMCQKAMEAARNIAEQRLVLDVLKRYPNPQALEIAINSLNKPNLRADARQAVLAISEKLSDNPQVQQRIRDLGDF